jgi:hypothetical protein
MVAAMTDARELVATHESELLFDVGGSVIEACEALYAVLDLCDDYDKVTGLRHVAAAIRAAITAELEGK